MTGSSFTSEVVAGVTSTSVMNWILIGLITGLRQKPFLPAYGLLPFLYIPGIGIVGTGNDFIPKRFFPNNNLTRHILLALYHLALLVKYGYERLETLIVFYLIMTVKRLIYCVKIMRHEFNLALRFLVVFLGQIKIFS